MRNLIENYQINIVKILSFTAVNIQQYFYFVKIIVLVVSWARSKEDHHALCVYAEVN